MNKFWSTLRNLIKYGIMWSHVIAQAVNFDFSLQSIGFNPEWLNTGFVTKWLVSLLVVIALYSFITARYSRWGSTSSHPGSVAGGIVINRHCFSCIALWLGLQIMFQCILVLAIFCYFQPTFLAFLFKDWIQVLSYPTLPDFRNSNAFGRSPGFACLSLC